MNDRLKTEYIKYKCKICGKTFPLEEMIRIKTKFSNGSKLEEYICKECNAKIVLR